MSLSVVERIVYFPPLTGSPFLGGIQKRKEKCKGSKELRVIHHRSLDATYRNSLVARRMRFSALTF